MTPSCSARSVTDSPRPLDPAPPSVRTDQRLDQRPSRRGFGAGTATPSGVTISFRPTRAAAASGCGLVRVSTSGPCVRSQSPIASRCRSASARCSPRSPASPANTGGRLEVLTEDRLAGHPGRPVGRRRSSARPTRRHTLPHGNPHPMKMRKAIPLLPQRPGPGALRRSRTCPLVRGIWRSVPGISKVHYANPTDPRA